MHDTEVSVEAALEITTNPANETPVTVWDIDGRTWFTKLVCIQLKRFKSLFAIKRCKRIALIYVIAMHTRWKRMK